MTRSVAAALIAAFVYGGQLGATSPTGAFDCFVAVDDAAVTILDAESLAPIHRFETRSIVRGTPVFSNDARHAFIVTAAGWIAKLDLAEHRVVAETRASTATRDLALSSDEHYVAVASDSPPALIVLDAMALKPIKVIPVEGGTGLRALATAASRQSFIAAPAGIAELWEVSYSDNPPHRGWVHDYRDDGVPAQRPRFPLRRMEQRSEFDAIVLDDSGEYVIATSPRTSSLQVIDLYGGRRFAEIPWSGQPHLAASAQWARGDELVLAIPDRSAPTLRLIDRRSWREVGPIAMPLAISRVYSHPGSRYAWASGEAIHIIEKSTLAIAHTLAPGRPVTAITFDRQGRRALISVDGLLITYDTVTLTELTRAVLPGSARVYGVGSRAPQ